MRDPLEWADEDAPPDSERKHQPERGDPVSAGQAAAMGLQPRIQRLDLHEHQLTLYSRRYAADSYLCDLCGSQHSGAAYACIGCGWDAAPACVEDSDAALARKNAALEVLRERMSTAFGRSYYWLQEANVEDSLPKPTAPFLEYVHRLTLAYAVRILREIKFDAQTGRIRCPHFLLSALAERKALNEPARQRRNAHQQLALAYSDSRVGQMPTIGAQHWIAEFAQAVPSCAEAANALTEAQQEDLVAIIDSFLQTLAELRIGWSKLFEFPGLFSVFDLATAFHAEPLFTDVVDWMMEALIAENLAPSKHAWFDATCPRVCVWEAFLPLEFGGKCMEALQRLDLERSWYHDEALVQRYANEYAAGRLLQGDSYFSRRYGIRPVQMYSANLSLARGLPRAVAALMDPAAPIRLDLRAEYYSYDLVTGDGRELSCFARSHELLPNTRKALWPDPFRVRSRSNGRVLFDGSREGMGSAEGFFLPSDEEEYGWTARDLIAPVTPAPPPPGRMRSVSGLLRSTLVLLSKVAVNGPQ